MTTLLIKTQSKAVPEILSAIQAIVPLTEITLLEEEPLPPPADQAKKDFEELAQRVATKIRPKANQKMRSEANQFVLMGKDTFKVGLLDSFAGDDPSLRNALGALSKSLRSIFQWEQSPLDKIARREKHFHKDGSYLGTRYVPTKLGIRVREILEANGDF
jgi:hypothetical protein